MIFRTYSSTITKHAFLPQYISTVLLAGGGYIVIFRIKHNFFLLKSQAIISARDKEIICRRFINEKIY